MKTYYQVPNDHRIYVFDKRDGGRGTAYFKTGTGFPRGWTLKEMASIGAVRITYRQAIKQIPQLERVSSKVRITRSRIPDSVRGSFMTKH